MQAARQSNMVELISDIIPAFKSIVGTVESDCAVFLTGQSGVGKSTLSKLLCDDLGCNYAELRTDGMSFVGSPILNTEIYITNYHAISIIDEAQLLSSKFISATLESMKEKNGKLILVCQGIKQLDSVFNFITAELVYKNNHFALVIDSPLKENNFRH